jgi:hypothetical protein
MIKTSHVDAKLREDLRKVSTLQRQLESGIGLVIFFIIKKHFLKFVQKMSDNVFARNTFQTSLNFLLLLAQT